jgi:mono/diheme cytochrome c family protein
MLAARPLSLLGVVAVLIVTTLGAARAADLKNGAYVFKAAGCTGCHTRDDDRKQGVMLAGGRAFKTPFGTYYSPNITPDESGIGSWSEVDFLTALRHGKSPDNSNYFPVFPYVSYTKMSDTDIADMWAYLKTMKPVQRTNRAHDVNIIFGSRFLMTFWKLLNFEEGPLEPAPGQNPSWNRGRYLVDAMGHCGECHTPRNKLGAMQSDMYLSGSINGPDGNTVPNITPDKSTGLGAWAADDFDSLLSMGMLPDGDFVGGSMGEAIENTEGLSNADRKAVTTYLKSIPAISHKIEKPKSK